MSGTDFTKTHGRTGEDCKKAENTCKEKKMNEDSELEKKSKKKNESMHFTLLHS